MKVIFTIATFLAFFAYDCFTQCKGSESFLIDNFIESKNNTEKIQREKRNKKKIEKPLSLENLSVSGNRNEAVITPDWAIGFSEGLAKIIVKGKSGFINRVGKVVIAPLYKWISCFSNGLAAVEVNGKWGFINSKNKLVIPARFEAADNFSEGLALVKIGKFWGYINKKGQFAVPTKFEEASSFSEGFASIGFYDKTKSKWQRRFVDKLGNWANGKVFDDIHRNFTKGLAIVSRNLGYSEKFRGMISQIYIIDAKGNELWKLDSWHITQFSDDMIVVAVNRDENTKRTKYSFLDRNGKSVTEKVFDNLDGFSEGLAVATINQKDGFIDKSGKFVIEPKFFSATSFSGGLAAVWLDGESGFIDKLGNWKIKLKFNNTEGFREGRAAIETNDWKIGYIDKQGIYIWKPTK